LDGAVGVESGVAMVLGSPRLDCRQMGAKTCLQASAVVFNGSVSVITGATRVIEFGTAEFADGSEIYVMYTGDSAQETLTGIPIIHAELTKPAAYSVDFLNVSGPGLANPRQIPFDSEEYRGFAVSVPSIGDYTFTGISMDAAQCRSLVHEGSPTFSALTQGDTFYGNVGVVQESAVCHPPTMTPEMTAVPTASVTQKETPAMSSMQTISMTVPEPTPTAKAMTGTFTPVGSGVYAKKKKIIRSYMFILACFGCLSE
jgi:hypothetical protein